jgi:hypothetical protein
MRVQRIAGAHGAPPPSSYPSYGPGARHRPRFNVISHLAEPGSLPGAAARSACSNACTLRARRGAGSNAVGLACGAISCIYFMSGAHAWRHAARARAGARERAIREWLVGTNADRGAVRPCDPRVCHLGRAPGLQDVSRRVRPPDRYPAPLTGAEAGRLHTRSQAGRGEAHPGVS